MSISVPTYSPELVRGFYNVAGVEIAVTGLADGTSIEASRNTPNMSHKVGTDGKVSKTKMVDKTGNIAFTLFQNSTTNIEFSIMQAVQDETDELIEGDLVLFDPSGGAIVRGQGCVLMETPNVAFGDEDQNRTWTFHSDRLIFTRTPVGISNGASLVARLDSRIDSLISAGQQILQQRVES